MIMHPKKQLGGGKCGREMKNLLEVMNMEREKGQSQNGENM